MPETAEELNLVSLEKGAQATTAIEGNTLTQEQVALLARGELQLPPSKEYLGVEVKNILRGFNEMLDVDPLPALDAERVEYLNAVVLDGLDLDEGIVAGDVRTHEVGVARYRGAPAEHCEYLSEDCRLSDGAELAQWTMALPTGTLKAGASRL